MAKAKIVSDDTETNADAERMADLNEGEGGELFRAIEEARSTQGAEVILTRTMPADKAGFCDKIPVAEFDLTMLKTKYGPGTYRVRFNGPTGFLPGGSTIKIAATPEKLASISGNSDFQTFLESQARRDAERSSKIWELAMLSVPALIAGLFNRQPPQNDITGLVAALKPDPGPTLSDLSTVMVNMLTLAAPKNSETNVDMILKVFETAQNLMGGEKAGTDKEGSNWVDVIRDLIKAAPAAIQPMLQARVAAAMQTGQVTQVQTVPNPALAAKPNASPAQPPTMNTSSGESAETATNPSGGIDMRALWEPIAKQHLAKVFMWAEKQRDPDVYAEVFVDELPDLSAYFTVDQILEHLRNPGWFEKVCELEPRLSAHKDFCTDMHAAVVEIVESLKEKTAPVNDQKANAEPDSES